ncbi:hypothetical protein D3C72_2137620 [compost metagenome]
MNRCRHGGAGGSGVRRRIRVRIRNGLYRLRCVMRRLAGFDAAFWRADDNGILDWGQSGSNLLFIETVSMGQNFGWC